MIPASLISLPKWIAVIIFVTDQIFQFSFRIKCFHIFKVVVLKVNNFDVVFQIEAGFLLSVKYFSAYG